MTQTNWHWDLNLSLKKIERILAREDDPRFPRLAATLLARVQDPQQVFALITPRAFCRRFRAIQHEIAADAWTRERAAFWKATYLRLSKELRDNGERLRQPARIVLDDVDRAVINQVKACRKHAVMSQQELAQFMGCSQQYISGIETGRERITLEFLKKLAALTSQRIEVVIEMPRPGLSRRPHQAR